MKRIVANLKKIDNILKLNKDIYADEILNLY